MDQVLSGAEERFQSPLESFRKQHLEAVRKTRKELEKRTGRACAAQDRHANTSSKREDALAEAAEAARSERRQLEATSLRYVYLIHVARERKKVEFVEAVLGFMQSWANFYR